MIAPYLPQPGDLVWLFVTWAVGLNPDVAGLIALTFVGIGALAQMARTRAGDEDGGG